MELNSLTTYTVKTLHKIS